MKMKHAVTIAKLFLSYMVISIAVVFAFEISRIRDTQQAMIMFSRIAGNYALTASQDAGYITGTNRDSIMYDRYEYGEYISMLNSAVASTSDATLSFATAVLESDYNRACSESPNDSLDAYLRYTPISFNLPYMSQHMLEECYSEAMVQMVVNYKSKGRPSVFVPASNNYGYNMSYAGGSRIVDIDDGDSNDSYVKFDVVELNDALITSIYGNKDYYSNSVLEVFKNLDFDMYDDPRIQAYIDAKQSGMVMDIEDTKTYIPQYNITFTTPYFYITGSSLLQFGRSKLFFGTGGGVANNIHNAEDANVYNSNGAFNNLRDSGYRVSNPIYSNGIIEEGQLMLHLGNMCVAQSTFTYTFLG